MDDKRNPADEGGQGDRPGSGDPGGQEPGRPHPTEELHGLGTPPAAGAHPQGPEDPGGTGQPGPYQAGPYQQGPYQRDPYQQAPYPPHGQYPPHYPDPYGVTGQGAAGHGAGGQGPGGQGAAGGYPGHFAAQSRNPGPPHAGPPHPGQSPSVHPHAGAPGAAAGGPSGHGTAARRRPGLAVLAAGALAFALVGGAVGGVTGAYFASEDGGGSSAVQALSDTTTKAQPTASAPAGSIQEVAQKVLPSVVEIKVATPTGGGEGSGIILSQDGMILTNAHVATAESNGPVEIQVSFADGSTTSAKLVAADRTTDIAVLKADKTGLDPIEIGSSSNLKVGQQVVAIGSPLGLSGTVTSGIISALHRPVSTSGTSGDQATVIDAIQTDAAINPGNSGGALVNMNGQLVGMNTAIASLGQGMGQQQSGSIGLGFAIPVDQAKRIAEDLIKTGDASLAQIGITVPVRSNVPGAPVMSVLPGGPADKAGIKRGQVITKVNDRDIGSGDALIAAVRSHVPGDKVTVTVTDANGGNEHTVEVTLGEASDD